MSVYQISRIQIRRGKATSNTGFPQLASGEMGWAIDTQELYIGNGSVAEGAPAVGNTKILTQNDLTGTNSFLSSIEHIYKYGDNNVQTGVTVNNPISRPIQDCLDDRVTVADFGAVGDGITDDTDAIQRAIDQLFLNSAGTASNVVGQRVVLEIPAGTYKITNTIIIPSFAALVGAGPSRSIFEYTGTDIAVRIIGDPLVVDSVADSVILKGLTIHSLTEDQIALELNNTTNGLFDELVIQGDWNGTYNVNSKGISFSAFSSLVTCERNTFTNVTILGFSHAVYAKGDIINNKFNNCIVNNSRQGFVLGQNANGTSVGEEFGPRNTEISNCTFDLIMRHAVYIELGSGNIVTDAVIVNVGNDGGSHSAVQYPQIYFKVPGNSANNIQSDRTLGLERSYLSSTVYVPEVGGKVSYDLFGVRRVGITQVSSPTLMFRLPVSTTSDGIPEGSIGYKLDYTYRSGNNNFSRRGTITISVDITTGTKQLSDEYDFSGTDSSKELVLDFRVILLNQVGTEYTGALGQVVASVGLYYTNTLSGDYGDFAYTYKTQLFDI